MLNAHNELYKFADCLNININNKPIPSKHFNTTIVYSCGKMKRKKNSWKRHKREDLTRLRDLMELSKQWFQFISKHIGNTFWAWFLKTYWKAALQLFYYCTVYRLLERDSVSHLYSAVVVKNGEWNFIEWRHKIFIQ